MPQDYGAAQPIVSTFKNLERYNPAEWLRSLGRGSPAVPQDTSWHDEMVRRATASFLPPKATPAATGAAQVPVQPAKRVPKRVVPRTLVRTAPRAAAGKRR